MPLPANPFGRACAEIVGTALELSPELFVVGTPPRPELGDFAVGCFPAAREKKAAPPALAAAVVDAFEPTDRIAEASAAGPFVNFRADRSALYRHAFEATLGEGELIPTAIGAGKTICIDYSSPNISKHLAYHHIRSTVIGHALVNLYRAVGYRVIGINHLGDWGTTHGMLLAAYEKWGAPEPLTVDALNDLYVRFTGEMKTDAALVEAGRAWFVKLEDGDAEARELWQRFRDVSWAEFESVYQTLGIEFEEVRGESEFEKDMPAVLELLERKNLSSESQGALVVALDDLDLPPLLLKKKDGATLYATRDLAAAIYRWQTYGFERSLYVVDRGQGLHFKQLFTVLGRAGFDWSERCHHISFGLIRIGGKKTGSRAGNVVLLRDVLAEACERARAPILDKTPEMPADRLAATAEAVGVGAVVFANLLSQRDKDVDFEWEDVLATDGDSGVYLQYAHARCANILVKSGDPEPAADTDPSPLVTDAEWAVARKITDFADVVARAADSNDPHLVSRYLLDLATTFSRWYHQGNEDAALRMLVDDLDVRAARVALASATREVLRRGLELLGLRAPHPM